VGKRFAGSFALLGYAVFSLLALAALLELGSWAIWSAYHGKYREGQETQAASPVYAGIPWAGEFWREEFLRQKSRHGYVPFLLWGVGSWHGKYVNNDESKTGEWRRTVNPARDDCSQRHVIVWTFGGSTMYGTGVPDWATLASYLSRELNAGSSECVLVTNFGVEGYVGNQELILLMEQLKAGGRPDIVIFYDGVNDAAAAGPPGEPPTPHFIFATIKNRIEGSVSGRLDFVRDSYTFRLARAIRAFVSRRHPSRPVPDELDPKAAAALDNYEANLRVAKALGKAYNFRVYCFWQPSLFYGGKPLVPFEKQLHENAATDSWSLAITAVYREAETRAIATKSFIFLGDIFDSVPEAIYLDETHLGPRGNELAAQAVAKYMEEHPQD
jgi:lysophospholipase L1-like esterase